jgi:hypothetical protein
MAVNGYGLLHVAALLLSSPELKPNKKIKVQVNYQKPNRIPSSPNQSAAMQ